jgi:gas vesicle protein
MIRTSIARGASEQRIAAVLRVDVKRIRQSLHLLDGVAPEAVKMLRDRQVTPAVFKILRKMKPMRQLEAVEMMAAANRFSPTYAKMVLVTSRPEHLVAPLKSKKTAEIAEEDIVRMEQEMERLHQDYQAVEDGIGDTMLTLVVAKSFMTRLLRNKNIQDHLKRHHGDLIESLMSTMEAITTDNRTLERE